MQWGLAAAAPAGSATAAGAAAAGAATATDGQVGVDNKARVGQVDFNGSSARKQLLVYDELEAAFKIEDLVGFFWLIQSQ
ncbi:hypothetical protein JCM16814_31950 [Desulfobaculum senezii]